MAKCWVPMAPAMKPQRKGTNALPEGTAANIQTALSNAIGNRDLQNELRWRVLQRVNVAKANNAIDLGASKTVDPSTLADYSQFTASGVDTVLEISTAQIVLPLKAARPPLSCAR